MTGAINFSFRLRLPGRSKAARKCACSRTQATAALPRNFGIHVTRFVPAIIGFFGALRIAAKASPCKRWVQVTARRRLVSAMSTSERRLARNERSNQESRAPQLGQPFHREAAA